ncbi:MAG TPA: hypothetical protein O0W90_00740, partial [Methanocorpusculum sp.]|nr:hypothetical protein [Methanocorpusculum sp.]
MNRYLFEKVCSKNIQKNNFGRDYSSLNRITISSYPTNKYDISTANAVPSHIPNNEPHPNKAPELNSALLHN